MRPVEYEIPVVGYESFPSSFAQTRFSAQGIQVALDHIDRERNDFNGNGKFNPKASGQLAVIDNDDHVLRGMGHDLLAHERAATPFQKIEVVGHLIGPVDGHVDNRVVAQGRQGYSHFLRKPSRTLGTGYPLHPKTLSYPISELSYENFRSGAAPQPHNHPVLDGIQSRDGGLSLQFINHVV